MGVNVPGLVAIIVFYLLILLVGIFAARKTGLKVRNISRQDVMMAGRNIGLFVGIFTMTGMAFVVKCYCYRSMDNCVNT